MIHDRYVEIERRAKVYDLSVIFTLLLFSLLKLSGLGVQRHAVPAQMTQYSTNGTLCLPPDPKHKCREKIFPLHLFAQCGESKVIAYHRSRKK